MKNLFFIDSDWLCAEECLVPDIQRKKIGELIVEY